MCDLVGVSPTLSSSDCFTPASLPRPTQTNIGQVLTKNKSIPDESFGCHYTLYGGTGGTLIDGNLPIRTHHHHRTALYSDVPGPVSERWRNTLVKRNYGFYSQTISDCASTIHKITKEGFGTFTLHPSQVERSFFPRSVVYELEYTKKIYRQRMLEALEKERADIEARMYGKKKENEDKTDSSKQPPQDIALDQPWVPKPPFWYKEAEQVIPKGSSEDLTTTALIPPLKEHNWLEEMQIERPERYLPGEIYKKTTPKEPVEDLSKASGCTGEWQPRDPMFAQKFDPKHFEERNVMLEDVMARAGTPMDPLHALETRGGKGAKLIAQKPHTLPESKQKPLASPKKGTNQIETGRCGSHCTECGCTMKKCSNETSCKECQQKKVILGKKKPDYQSRAPPKTPSLDSIKKGEFGYTDTKGTPCEHVNWPESGKEITSGKQRLEEMLKAGRPFRTEATRWMECNIGPLEKDKEKRTEKKKFPDWGVPSFY